MEKRTITTTTMTTITATTTTLLLQVVSPIGTSGVTYPKESYGGFVQPSCVFTSVLTFIVSSALTSDTVFGFFLSLSFFLDRLASSLVIIVKISRVARWIDGFVATLHLGDDIN